jgi:hypothetical protein
MSVHAEWGDGQATGLLEAMGSPADTLPHMWWLRITGPHGIPAIIQIPQGMEDLVTITEELS